MTTPVSRGRTTVRTNDTEQPSGRTKGLTRQKGKGDTLRMREVKAQAEKKVTHDLSANGPRMNFRKNSTTKFPPTGMPGQREKAALELSKQTAKIGEKPKPRPTVKAQSVMTSFVKSSPSTQVRPERSSRLFAADHRDSVDSWGLPSDLGVLTRSPIKSSPSANMRNSGESAMAPSTHQNSGEDWGLSSESEFLNSPAVQASLSKKLHGSAEGHGVATAANVVPHGAVESAPSTSVAPQRSVQGAKRSGGVPRPRLMGTKPVTTASTKPSSVAVTNTKPANPQRPAALPAALRHDRDLVWKVLGSQLPAPEKK